MKLNDHFTLKGHYRFTKRDIKTGKVTGVYLYENIIPTVARTALVNLICNATPTNPSMLANYVALGTGVTAPANGDTSLQTETYRNLVASMDTDANIGYITGFFNATEASGTFKEAGVFCAGTAIANSGILLSRVAINITKSGSESLTVDWTLTIN
jgi:hypothetical protein